MKIQTSNNSLTVQLRYCFEDEKTHSMNAEVFNECERQFIQAIQNVEKKYFEESLQIKVKPREEGSLTDILDLISQNPSVNIVLGALIGFLFSRIPQKLPKPQQTSTIVGNISKIREAIKTGNLTQEEADAIMQDDKTLRKYQSKYFKSAKKDTQIIKIEATTKKSNSYREDLKLEVERKDFDSFILSETEEKEDETEEAKIFIVAPILIKGRRDAWKGIYENHSIEFKITDKDFLEHVWNKQINFQNGTFINCELKITKTINIETEEIKITREVINVRNYGEDKDLIRKVIHRRKSYGTEIVPMPSLFDNFEL